MVKNIIIKNIYIRMKNEKLKFTEEECHPQFQKIIDKIREKYKSTSLKCCRNFLENRVEGMSPELVGVILQKFIESAGSKDEYSDQSMRYLLMVTSAAQRNIQIKEMDPNNFVKFRSKTLKMLEKSKESKKPITSEQSNINLKQETNQIVQKTKQIPLKTELKQETLKKESVDQQPQKKVKQSKEEKQMQKITYPTFQQNNNKKSNSESPNNNPTTNTSIQSQQDAQTLEKNVNTATFQIPLTDQSSPSSSQDSRTNILSPLPIVKQPPLKQKSNQSKQGKESDTNNQRKFSFGNENLQVSISTRMNHEIIIENDSNNQVNIIPEIQTPKFTKKLSDNSKFFESQLQLTVRQNSQKKISNEKLKISINKYEKFIEGWSNIFKYEIKTANQEREPVWRRYSDFVKLQGYLKQNYKGIIIPELPPKENLLATFWQTDIKILNERKIGLEFFLNKLLSHEIVGKDPLVLRFIDDNGLDESAYNHKSLIGTAEKYLNNLMNIATSTQQLKDYGLAYFSYIKTATSVDDSQKELDFLFQDVSRGLSQIILLKTYCEKTIQMNLKKNKIQAEFSSQKSSVKQESYLKELLKQETEYNQAKYAYQQFNKLKTQRRWLELLYLKKKNKNKQEQEQLKQQLKELEIKITKVSTILEREMKQFLESKQKQRNGLFSKLSKWKQLNLNGIISQQ